MKHLRDEKGITVFGKRLRDIRLQKALSQQELAWKADVEVMQISRMERGVVNTTLSQILNVARALEVPASILFEPQEENTYA